MSVSQLVWRVATVNNKNGNQISKRGMIYILYDCEAKNRLTEFVN